MRRFLVRIAPPVFGVLLVLFILHPPAILDSLGALKPLVVGALALLAFLAVLIEKGLPSDVTLEPVRDDILTSEMELVVQSLEALGFRRGSLIYEVGVSPPAILVPLVDETGLIYSTVYRTGTMPPRVAWDLVSIVSGFRGGLTTASNPGSATLPACPGSMRQVFHDASLEQLLLRHRAAMAHAKRHGLDWKRVSLAHFEHDFRQAMNRERAAFLRRPWLYPPVALWRSVTKRSPHIGPLADQTHGARTIRDIIEGRARPQAAEPIG